MAGMEEGKMGNGGPGGSPDECGRGKESKAWKGARISSHHIKLPLPPPLACGEEEGLRWAPAGPLEPFLLLTRGHVDQL